MINSKLFSLGFGCSECEDCFWCGNKGCFEATKTKEEEATPAKNVCFPLIVARSWVHFCYSIIVIIFFFSYIYKYIYKLRLELWKVCRGGHWGISKWLCTWESYTFTVWRSIKLILFCDGKSRRATLPNKTATRHKSLDSGTWQINAIYLNLCPSVLYI